MSSSLRSQLIGAWELIEYCAHKEDDESDKVFPMGPNAQGIIMYTPDGYMSAQLLTPGQEAFDVSKASESVLAKATKNFAAYTGEFYLDERGDEKGRPILMHHMRTSSLPYLVGDTQRRLVKITEEKDGRYLNLGLDGTVKVQGEDRIIRVRWRRFPDNSRGTAPPKM